MIIRSGLYIAFVVDSPDLMVFFKYLVDLFVGLVYLLYF